MPSPDRLSPLDASFLALEDRGTAHMHVAGVLVFEGSPPAYDELLAGIEARLHLVPRYRQRLATVPGGAARPTWVDDEHFSLRYHVRRTALPSPRTESELRTLAGRVFSQRLDRSKPLWEMWLVEELEGDRFAVLSKTHHCLVDGVSGVDITTVLFDLEPDPPTAPTVPEPWTPRNPPSTPKVVIDAVRDTVGDAVGTARQVAGTVASPARLTSTARAAAAGAGLVAQSRLDPSPPSIYNVPIGPHRRFAWTRYPLDEVKAIKNALAGTVNDVVLAAVAGMLRRHLQARREPVPAQLRAMVPVSVRSEEERGALGNRVTSMYAPLPTGTQDPVGRLHAVSEAMRGLKEGSQAVGAEFLVNLGGFAPPTLMQMAGREFASARVFNVTVTNVPGPQFPLYMAGSRLQELVPMVPLAEDHALGVAIMSYDGGLSFGLVGDLDALPDLDELVEHLDDALAELAEAAGVEHAVPA